MIEKNEFHLKYRPDNLDDIVGQRHVVASVKWLLDSGSIPHSWLLSGPSGVGKTTLARILAAELGCGDAVVEVDAASYGNVDYIRNLIESTKFRPMGDGLNKLFIFDECHSLSSHAWQALLKPIEEPPEYIYFCFCTTILTKVPKTIKTRCTSYELESINRNDLEDLIEDVAQEEEIEVDDKIITSIAKAADGSARAALVMLNEVAGVDDYEDIKDLLKSQSVDSEAVEIARLLMGNKSNWSAVMKLINNMGDKYNPDTVRYTLLAYFKKVVMGTKQEKEAQRILRMLYVLNRDDEKEIALLTDLGDIIFWTE